jgi:hypothetical protein
MGMAWRDGRMVMELAIPAGQTCQCVCHNVDGEPIRFGTCTLVPLLTGVDRADPIGAVTACDGCVARHCVALLNHQRWRSQCSG